MKNLALIHLESLNVLNYRINKELYPALEKWENRSIVFENYYASATSTLMLLSDMAYGGLLQNEPCQGIRWRMDRFFYTNSFLDRLKEGGYRILAIACPPNPKDVNAVNRNHFIGRSVDLEESESFDEMMDKIEELTTAKGPFVLWACSYVSNVSYNSTAAGGEALIGIDRWKNGYFCVDRQVNAIMELFSDRGLLSDTTIVFYGDHGDEIYTHGLHGGLTHVVEPYSTMTHTPLFLYDARFQSGKIEELVSTVDLAGIIETVLGLPEKPLKKTDIPLPRRTYAISRNLFAAQNVYEDIFEKAYSVTDGRFLLMAGNHGLEMYETKMDPTCHHDLLDYFDLVDGQILLDHNFLRGLKYHFPYVFDNASLETITERFNTLLPILKTEVENLYEYAGCRHRLVEIDFSHIRYGTEAKDRRTGKEHPAARKDGFGLYLPYFKGKRTVIYGAGKYGTYCFNRLKDREEIVAWIDQNKTGDISSEKERLILSPETIPDLEFDLIYIAILDTEVKQEVYTSLIDMDIPKEKII